jgi:hypothetical protein
VTLALESVSKEGKPQRIDSQMPFDTICCFVMTKPLGRNAGITSVLNSLGVNHD